MPIELLVFGLWLAACFLVVWQVVLTIQIQNVRRDDLKKDTSDVGVGMLYNGLIEELRQTADQKIGLLEQRIAELEALLDRCDDVVAGPVVRPTSFERTRLRRCG